LNSAFLRTIESTAQRFSPFEGRCMERAVGYEDDTIYVEGVMDIANRARARELPGHSLFIVTKRLIKKSTEKWEAPSYKLLQSVYHVLTKETNRMVDEHFHRFRCGRLHQDVKSIVNRVLETCQASALRMIKQLLTMEGKAPFTLHEPNLVTSREQLLKGYREERWPQLRKGITHSRPEDLIARDEYDQALMYMANARAYFLIAFERFTDMVSMMIDQELLRGLDWDRGLNSALTKGLGITGPGSLQKATEYLQEPPDVRSRREKLSRKHERLLTARRELQNI